MNAARMQKLQWHPWGMFRTLEGCPQQVFGSSTEVVWPLGFCEGCPEGIALWAGKLLAGGLGLKSRFVGHDGQECTVEALALQYYASEQGGCWQGMHQLLYN